MANLSVGIVGLANVGKSTLFNALLKKQAALAANYPFATIEPNIGIVPVPDERLKELAKIIANENPKSEALNPKQISNSNYQNSKIPPIKPATVEFVDIAGLVKGASEGAGLGNKFLSHIREVKIIAHVVRAFEDPNIVKEGSVDPKSDYQTIETELILADLQTIRNSKFKAQSAKHQIKNQNEIIRKIEEALDRGIPLRTLGLSSEEREIIDSLFLLSEKPEIIVLNVSEEQISNPSTTNRLQQEMEAVVGGRSSVVTICAKIEEELASLSEEEQRQYLSDLGLEASGLERLIQKAYEKLGLISFLTAGEKEVRAWTIKRGSTAVEAAGEIHTDFMKKFIKAEVVSFDDFVSCGGWKKARELGKTRLEGKDYIMQDGDVVEYKIGG